MTTFCLQTIYFSSRASSEVWNYRSKTSCMEVQNINNSANYSTSQQHETIFATISVRWPNFQQPIFHAKIMALMSLWIVYYDVNGEWNQTKWAWVPSTTTTAAAQHQLRSLLGCCGVSGQCWGRMLMMLVAMGRGHTTNSWSTSQFNIGCRSRQMWPASAVLKLLLNQRPGQDIYCEIFSKSANNWHMWLQSSEFAIDWPGDQVKAFELLS